MAAVAVARERPCPRMRVEVDLKLSPSLKEFAARRYRTRQTRTHPSLTRMEPDVLLQVVFAGKRLVAKLQFKKFVMGL